MLFLPSERPFWGYIIEDIRRQSYCIDVFFSMSPGLWRMASLFSLMTLLWTVYWYSFTSDSSSGWHSVSSSFSFILSSSSTHAGFPMPHVIFRAIRDVGSQWLIRVLRLRHIPFIYAWFWSHSGNWLSSQQRNNWPVQEQAILWLVHSLRCIR